MKDETFKAIIFSTMTVVLLSTASLCAEDVWSGIHALGDADLPASGVTAPETTGCGTNVSARYTGGFDPQHFDWVNMDVDERGCMSLNSAAMSGRPDKVVIPFEQEVFATFVSESTAYASNLGWILHADAVDENGHFLGWSAIDERNRHIIFRHVVDDDVTGACCGSGNGILDTDYGTGDFKTDSETVLAGYDDGSATTFLIDRDGEVTPRDMKKRLGRFAAGSEIVFYLTADKASESTENPPVYFNQPWSQDVYAACVPGYGSPLWVDQVRGIFDKLFLLGEAVEEESCQAQTHWLSKPVLDRLSGDFDVQLFGEYRLPLIIGERFAHMIGGVAQNNADQWVYGFEDGEAIIGEPDMDFSDVVFLVDQPNGGSAALSPPHALKPFETGAFFTTVDLEVCDYQPTKSCTGRTSLTYSVSVDLGSSWIPVNRWDSGRLFSLSSDGAILRGHTIDPTVTEADGPEYTCRKRRIDLIKRGLTGNRLLWKVDMMNARGDCLPQVLEVQIDAATATNRSLPAAAPAVQANLIYTGWVETPATGWNDHSIRGHLTAREIYHPARPDRTLPGEHILWDAGEMLADTDPDQRTIYFPDIDVRRIVNEHLIDDSGRKIYGDGKRISFKGTLAHHPVMGTSVRIYDGRPEVFSERHSSTLTGNFGGTGTIDYTTGKWEIRFSRPPAAGVPVMGDYKSYTLRRSLKPFLPAEVTNEMLVLSAEYVWPDGFTHDFNGDGAFDTTEKQSDSEWLVQWTRGYRRPDEGITKDWLLGGIGSSVPALLAPPGYPRWLSGTAVTDNEGQSYAEFREAQKDRDSMLFVGSGGGLLHAFDAGSYRYGDNPETPAVRENRGYFAWEAKTADSPPYCENYSGSKCPDYGSGKEIWAFIPAGLLPHLKNNVLSGNIRVSVDILPVISDVFIDTDGDGRSDSWRTVLVGTAGIPGLGVFCLDVTDPHNPEFLWEWIMADLDRDGISPAVARIGRTLDSQTGEPVWTAFVSTGRVAQYGNYPAVYLLDMSDGAVIQKIILDGRIDINGDGIVDADETAYGRGEILSGQPAIVDTDNNGFVDRVYVASSRGFIYKVNIPDDPQDPYTEFTDCVINTDFTDPNGQSIPLDRRWRPIYASPAVAVEPGMAANGEVSPLVRVFVGTGDNPYQADDIEDAMARNLFFAYTDETDKGVCNHDGHRLDWFVELAEGHRITASPFISAGRIYFGTSYFRQRECLRYANTAGCRRGPTFRFRP